MSDRDNYRFHGEPRHANSGGARVLVISQRQVKRLLGYGPFYEFEDVIESVESMDRVEIDTRGHESLWIRTSQRVNSALRLTTGGRAGIGGPLPGAEAAVLRRDYDLTFMVCVDIHDIRLLNLVRGLRDRSRRVAVFVPEQWPVDFGHYRLRALPYHLLDHIFVGFDDLVEPVGAVSGCPTSALPIAIDALRFKPTRNWLDRAFDLCWIGRRIESMHRDLVRLVDENGWRYYFDTFREASFDNLPEHRDWLARLLGDCRFAISHFSRVNQPVLTQGQRQVAGRHMESAAAGNVLVGAPPNTPQFKAVMPWPDAVIPIEPDEQRVDRMLLELASDPRRMNEISRRNVAGTLRFNDWAYRWASVLETMGMARQPSLDARLARLTAEASAFGDGSGG